MSIYPGLHFHLIKLNSSKHTKIHKTLLIQLVFSNLYVPKMKPRTKPLPLNLERENWRDRQFLLKKVDIKTGLHIAKDSLYISKIKQKSHGSRFQAGETNQNEIIRASSHLWRSLVILDRVSSHSQPWKRWGEEKQEQHGPRCAVALDRVHGWSFPRNYKRRANLWKFVAETSVITWQIRSALRSSCRDWGTCFNLILVPFLRIFHWI